MKKVSALAHISTYEKNNGKDVLWKLLLALWFGHCQLVWIFCSRRRLYDHLKLIHGQAMFTVPNDKVCTFKQFLPKSVFESKLEI